MIALAVLLALAADDGGVLERLRARMADDAKHLPNYTCVETIERHDTGRYCSGCKAEDRLRLEVVVTDGREQLLLPGGDTSEERAMDLAREGLIGLGDYAGYLKGIFVNPEAVFEYRGSESIDGRDLLRYSYDVSVKHSGAQLVVSGQSVSTGLAGTFWVEPNSLDLVRLVVNMTRIPPLFIVHTANWTTDYQRVTGRRQTFLVPARTERRLEYWSGSENRSDAAFTSCREYLGESVIRYEEASEEASPAAGKADARSIPEGTSLRTSLVETLDLRVAAAGDRIALAVLEPVKKGGKTIVPKGAKLRGRIVRLLQFEDGPFQNAISWKTVLGLRMTEVDTGTAVVPFRGRLDDVGGLRKAALPRVENHEPEAWVRFAGRVERIEAGLELKWESLAPRVTAPR